MDTDAIEERAGDAVSLDFHRAANPCGITGAHLAINHPDSSPAAVAPNIALEEKSFRVTSILMGSGTTPSLAVINGPAYGEGKFIRIPVQVQRINGGNVVLEHDDQTVVVPLQPPASTPKKSDTGEASKAGADVKAESFIEFGLPHRILT